MSRTVRWGIIGTGDVAERKSGPALYKADRSELVAVMNRTRSRAEEFAQRHGCPRVYDTVDALLADANLDAVYIATHPDTHADLTVQAAMAGKHVLCEKPMAMSLAETDRMFEVCQAQQVSLTVAFYRREFPVVKKLKHLLDARAIGRPLSICVDNYTPFSTQDSDPWRLDVTRSGGGMLMDVGSHRLDLMAHLFGMPEEIRGFASRQCLSSEVEDAAAMALRFAGDVLGSANFHWNTSVSRDELTVVGTDGVLSIGDLSGSAELTLVSLAGRERWTLPAPTPVHLPLVEKVVEHLLDGTTNPCSGEQGAIPNAIIEQLH